MDAPLLKNKRILIVDDEPTTLRLLKILFSRTGAQVQTTTNGPEALQALYTHQPDLVILDILMPDMDGMEVCRRTRALTDVPIIMLTVLNQDDQVIRALTCGADDYVTKPFTPDVLLARVEAVLRRARLPAPAATALPAPYADGYLTLDFDRRRVLVRGEPVHLTATEYRLLTYLFHNANRVLTFGQILSNVWGYDCLDRVEYVHVFIGQLRQKLEQDPHNPVYLLTENGIGYQFETQARPRP